MTISTRHQALIEETLNYSRVSQLGCLASNVAADELMHCDSSVLPEIEDVIRNQVVLGSSDFPNHNDLLHRHPGLLSLWVAYFKIGKEGHVPDIIAFIRSLDGSVLATAILAMRSVWHNKESEVTLPTSFLELLHEIAKMGIGSAAEVAKYQLRSVWGRIEQ